MFKVIVAPMFAGGQPDIYHIESEHLLAEFMIANSQWHCVVERWNP